MRDTKLWLLLLVSVQALAEQGLEPGGDEQASSCPLGARYKNFRKYLYTYSAESRNGVAGTANLRNGPKVSCKVELEVVQACSFILHTTECSLSEVSVIDPQGQPMYRQAAGSEAFQAAMERNPLSFVVERMTDVSLYPEEQEPKNILNVKRGIISALIAPALDSHDNREMATIHGKCKGSVVINAHEDIDTDVTVHRWDLSKCSHFSPLRLASSPLALIRGLHTPLSMLVSSSQECNYQFDNRRKHMTAAQCTEKHLFRPFSHDGQYGISSVVTQTLTLQDSAKINKRYFDIGSKLMKELHLEEAEDKNPMQSKDTALSTMRDLNSLTPDQGQQRTGLFHKLVTEMRGLHNKTLAAAVEEMMALSAPLTWQALAQCGTPECRSALLFQLKKPSMAGPVSDALVYAMSLARLQTSPEEVWDLLSMAETRGTRPVMYALSYAVSNLYAKTGEHHEAYDAVADLLKFRLGDCTGEEDKIFLILRVIGMIGIPVQEKVAPALLSCMSQSAASPSVQRTAIKALRKMRLTPEIRETLLQIYQDENALPQKRVAAYLTIMRVPGPSLSPVIEYFNNQMQDPEVRNFVGSHLANLWTYNEIPSYIQEQFLRSAEYDPEKKSRHHFWKYPYIGQLESHVIAEQYSRLPKEVILKYSDMMGSLIEHFELGIEGEGLEPFAETLVGEDALIPNLLSTIMKWLGDNTSPQVKNLFDKWIASVRGDRQRRQVPQDVLKELSDNINKFVESLNSQDSPEGLAYLRLMEHELGYIRTSDFKQLSEDIAKYASIVFKNMPTKAVKSLLSGTDNEFFAHYIFMDENMVLPTASGFPLKFSLSGVFAPGAKGGISISPNMHQLSFTPSAGVEFITGMGVHIPEFVTAGVEMHTNLYHGSAVNAQVTLTDGQVKLSIPPPEGNVQLLSISNKLLSISSSQPKIVPSLVEDRTDTNECHPLFTGLKYCTTMRYSNASSNNEAPYYPLTGETKFALELQPTGEVTEYTAAIAYKLLREGKEGRHKVDSVKITLKIEGSEPCEATATMKYNRNKNIFTTDLQVPDYDFEAGLRLTAGDSNVRGRKMRGFTIDVTNKNVPQLSLVARTRLESMKDAFVQIEMDIPSLHSKATTTASLKKDSGLILQLESNIDIPKMSSLQTAIIRYDENKVEAELKSDLNSDFDKLFPNMENMRNNLQSAIDDMLDQKVPKTDMKLRHIVSKGFEAVNIWLDKVAADVPYVKSLRNRRSIPELPTVPEKLFMKWETLFRYQFNKGRMTISLPLPLGGQSSNDLKIPPKLSIPKLYMPEIGLDIPANTIRIPSFTIPQNVDLSMPMLGLAELTTKVTSSLCSWEASVLGGNNTIDVPSFIGQYKIISDCPLPFKAEGAGMIMGTFEDSLKYVVNSSLSHSLVDVSFSISETIAWKDDVVGRTNYRLQASSPLGLSASLHSSSQSLSTDDQFKGDGDMDGDIKVGPLFARFEYTVSYMIDGKDDPVGKGESTFKLDSSLIQFENMINGDFKDNVMTLQSKTMTPNEALKHMLEMKVANCKFSLKSDTTGKVLSNTIDNKIDLGITCEAANLKLETETDDGTNRAYAILSGTLNSDGLETTMDGTVMFDSCRGSHKSFHKIHRVAGLTTTGTTNLQCSPLTYENAFDGKIDDTKATISLTSKVAGRDNNGELKVEGTVTSSQAAVNTALKGNLFDADMDYTSNIGINREGLTITDSMAGALWGMTARNSHSLKVTLWTLALQSKSDCFVCDGTSYKHDIKVNLKPFVATVKTDNDIELFDMSLSNEGQLKLEPLKIDLSGSITGASTEGDLIKHACSIQYADLAGFIKCSTNAKLSETQFNHNLDLQYAGLASKFSSEALINSKILRLESTLKTMAEPFSLTVDGILNSDSEVKFYGKHSSQLYSKLLFRAEPLGIAHSHDCRASATHEMPSGAIHETHLENKLEGVLTPSEQAWQWKTKSKLNDHAYNQDISAYNNEDKIGIEFAGVVFTNLLNKVGVSDDPEFQSDHSFENQEFSLSAFLKYDKNSDSHILSLPFIDNLPEAFEHLKTSIVNFLEAVQQYINGLDLNNVITQFRTTLEKIPKDVENHIRDLDLEGKFKQANEALVSWMQNYAISVDDLETFVENVREDFEKSVLDTASKIRDILVAIRDFVESGTWSDTISDFFTQFGTDLKAFDEKYEISKTLTRALEAIEDIIRQIDMEKLTDSSLAWLQELDTKYGVRDWLQEKVSELKQVIETFDITMLAQDIKDYIVSFDLIELIGHISDKLPTEDIKNTLETMKDILVNWLDEYEIDRKLNSVISKIQDLLQRYEIDKKFEMLTNDFIELVKQYKVHETLQQVVDELKKIEIEYFFNRFMQVLDDIINQLKSVDFKQSIEDLNEYISKTAKAIQEFDYKLNIDDANQKISEILEYVNDHIKTYEIPQKIEASRQFLREIQSTIWNYLDQLKATRVGELLTMLKDVWDKTAYKDIQFKIQDMLEDMRQRISDMDIQAEITYYLERASESYTNVLAYISLQLDKLIEAIRQVTKDHEILDQISNSFEGILNALKKAELQIPSFTVPLTDLTIPGVTIALQNLQDIDVPSQITIPKFTFLDIIPVSPTTFDFEELKQMIINLIDQIRAFELPMVELEAMFGDLRVLYMSDLPDLTFPGITLSEIRIPDITLPKLNCENFDITKLPIPEVKLPEIPSEVQVPAFGKLYGEVRISSPHYTLVTGVTLENSTTAPKSPQFTTTLSSQAKSTIELLEFSLDGTLRLEAPRMKKMVLKETLKASHMAFNIDHEGNLIFSGPSAEVTAKTTAKATTEVYTADYENTVELALKNGISASINANYNHNLNIPNADISSQVTMTQTSTAQFESGTISVTVGTIGSGKVLVNDFLDEGTHSSKLEFNVNIGTATCRFNGETKSKALTLMQDIDIESAILNHITINARIETETPFIKSSVLVLKGVAEMEDLKIDLKAYHNAELIGKASGMISNSLEFLAKPFEIVLDSKNKGNAKVLFPLKLTGKVDLQNDYGIILNSEKQRVCLMGLARFNQYKYNHNFTLDNNEYDVGIYGAMNGEANLDFLTVPLTIPEMTLPYFDVKTPMIKDVSLWEDFGLNTLLTTPRQSFDMNVNMLYQKNPDTHALYFDLVPVYNMINSNAEFLRTFFEDKRDWVFINLMDSYNQAKSQYEKYQIDTSRQPPRYFRVSGYTIPVLNIEVSAFRAEMPAFSFLIPKEVSTPSFKVPALGFSVPSYTLVLPSPELPVLHVPESLRELTLPTLRLPEVQNSIMIPAFGNMTYDFSFKSSVINLNANGGVYNQSDIVTKLVATSTSVFDVLKGKFEGTTRLTMNRGLKMATTMALEHNNVEGTHDGSISCTRRGLEATSANVVKVSSPVLTLELEQESRAHSHSSPNFGTILKGKYNFNIPYIDVKGNGDIEQKVDLGLHTTFISVESFTKGQLDGTVMETGHFSGGLNNAVSFFLSVNDHRSSVATSVELKYDHDNSKILSIEMSNVLALEASLRRVYAEMKYRCINEANIASFSTNGKQSALVTFEMVPLTTILLGMDFAISQPSTIGEAAVVQKIDLDITAEKQSLKWSDREQITSIVHACDLELANNREEVRIEATQSLEGHLSFLKSMKLPVYQKTLWDVLKFDQITNAEERQFINGSTIAVYTKSPEGYKFTLRDLRKLFRNINDFLEYNNLIDYVSLSHIFTTPHIDVPFTNFYIPKTEVDLGNIQIPDKITVNQFDINLPGVPQVTIPDLDIGTEYIEGEYISLKLPRFEAIFSGIFLPKFLDDILQMPCGIPPFQIPRKFIEIPEMSLKLPVAIFIPTFGALSTTVKVSSPIYTETWTTVVENKFPELLTSLKAGCTSTMVFLEYDLDAKATWNFFDDDFSMNGICKLTHSDFNINWKHTFTQNARTKRQESQDSSSHHTLNVDVRSPSFIDVSCRYASHKNGITASVSSPSAGFMGFQLQRRSPSQYYGKIFGRYPSSPDKDTDMVTVKATLRNSEKLSLQIAWNWNTVSDILYGVKQNTPYMAASLKKVINKYHTAHFGMDLNRVSLKMKNSLSNTIERAYHEVPQMFNSVENSIEQISQQTQGILTRAASNIPSVDLQEVRNRFSNKARELYKYYEKNARVLLDAIMQFLRETKFHLPGLEEKLSGQEIYHRVRKSVSAAIEQATKWFTSLMDAIYSYISSTEITLPYFDKVIRGQDILDSLPTMESIEDNVRDAMKRWENLRLETLFKSLNDFLKLCITKVEEFIQTVQLEELLSEVRYHLAEAGGTPVMEDIRSKFTEAQQNAATYKDTAKMKIQDMYNGLTMENINQTVIFAVDVFESHFYGGANEFHDLLRSHTQGAEPYIKIYSKKAELEIPLPFFWKSFNEWPTQTRE